MLLKVVVALMPRPYCNRLGSTNIIHAKNANIRGA